MAKVTVQDEQEEERGWSYEVVLRRADGAETTHRISLSWADHEYWTGGATPPSRIVERLAQIALAREADREIPERFDAATARRWWEDLDDVLREKL